MPYSVRLRKTKNAVATLALAVAPGLYILEDGQAGSLTQLGREVQFDSGHFDLSEQSTDRN